MAYFAVIDTETNWYDEVMSVGIVLADELTFEAVDSRYYIFPAEARSGGMYDSVLNIVKEEYTTVCSRREAMNDIALWLKGAQVSRIFAYNACFDCKHLPELSWLMWYDIMKIAAYRQHNPFIPSDALCCSTGRLKRRYGVEPMLQLLMEDCSYSETHNALFDAADELKIMKLLGRRVEAYECARIA